MTSDEARAFYADYPEMACLPPEAVEGLVMFQWWRIRRDFLKLRDEIIDGLRELMEVSDE